MLRTTSDNSNHLRLFIRSCATPNYRGWFIAIGYQIPFEGGRRWQQWLTEIRPLADNASRRAIRVPERCLPGVQLPYLFLSAGAKKVICS